MAIDTGTMSQNEKASGVTHLHLQFTLWYLLSTEKTLNTFDLSPPFPNAQKRNQRDAIIPCVSNPYTMSRKISIKITTYTS